MGQVEQKDQNKPRYMSSSEAIQYAQNRYFKEHGKMPVADLTFNDIGENEISEQEAMQLIAR